MPSFQEKSPLKSEKLLQSTVYQDFYYHSIISSMGTKNPNPSPTGKKFGFLMFGGDYGTRTCDLMRVKHRGAMPHGGRCNQQSFSTIFTVILEKSELFLEIIS